MSSNTQQEQQINKKMSQFEQKIKKLKNRPCPKLVNIFIRNEEYQYQVYDQTTIQKIRDRFIQNDYFNKDAKIIVQINGKKQDKLHKNIKQLLVEYKIDQSKNLDIKLIDLKQQQNKKMSAVAQQQIKQTKQQIKQSKKQQVELNKQITISVKQLKQLIKLIQNNKQCEERYKQFYLLLKDKIQIMNTNISNINMQKFIDSTKLCNFLTQLIKKQKVQRIPQQIGRDKILKQKLTQLYGQMNSIKKNNQFTKQIIQRFKNFDEQLMTQSFIATEKTEKTQKVQKQKKNQKYAGDQILILKKIQKNMNIIRQDRVKLAALMRQQSHLTQQIQKLKHQIQSKSMFRKGKIYQQQTISQTAQIKKDLLHLHLNNLQLRTYYINSPKYNTQIQQITNTIQKYQGQGICINTLQSLLSIRGTDIQINFLAKYLDSGRLNKQNIRVLMLIELQINKQQNKIITVYSTQGILKIRNPLLDTKTSQKSIKDQQQQFIEQKCQYGNGFIFDLANKTVYQSTNQSLILTYNEKFIYISNCIELFDMNKKLNVKLGKQGSKKHLTDQKDDLSNIFGVKKKLDIIGMQLFKVNLNYTVNKSIQSTSIKSSQKQKDYTDTLSTGEISTVSESTFTKKKV